MSAQPELIENNFFQPEVSRLSRHAFDTYFQDREDPIESVLSDQEMQNIKRSAGTWVTEQELISASGYDKEGYLAIDEPAVTERFDKLAGYLQETFGDKINPRDLERTDKFLRSTFAMYNDVPADPNQMQDDADGSFAFVVPARMSRKNTEYGQEVEEVIPIMKYVPREQRAALMIGLPPFVIDRYKVDETGKRGYLIFAPIYPDMQDDMGLTLDTLLVAQEKVDQAVNFAYQRLGTRIVGLGATIPAVTKYGQSIKNPNVITTTGHAGTVQIILETLKRAENEGRVANHEQRRKIGVLGLGAIGASIAAMMHSEYPDAELHIFDEREGLMAKIAEKTGATMAGSALELLGKSNVTVSAITGKIDLEGAGLPIGALEGKMIIDDSQPASFVPEQVNALGGEVCWVVGRDGDHVARTSYDYGGTLADDTKDLFGCEAEVACLSAEFQRLVATGFSENDALDAIRGIAINKAVSPESVAPIARLFMRFGVTAAPLQAFGKPL